LSELDRLATMACTSPEIRGRLTSPRPSRGCRTRSRFAVGLGQGAHGYRADVPANQAHPHVAPGCTASASVPVSFSRRCRPRAPEPVRRDASFRPGRACQRQRCPKRLGQGRWLQARLAVRRRWCGSGLVRRPRREAGPLSSKNGSPGGRRGRCFPPACFDGVTPARASLAKLQRRRSRP